MRPALLQLVRCPACRASGLASITDRELTKVTALRCGACGRSYPVVLDVLELFDTLDEDAQRERAARTGQVYDPAVEQARPYVSDPVKPWLWPSFAANVEQGIGLLYGVRGPILDVGPATCWSTRMIAARGYEAVAVDLSTTMLCAAAAQHETGVYFDRVAADMHNLPFGDAVFGAVFASATVHHSESLAVVLAELRRVLRPSGRIILVNEPVLGLVGRASDFGAEDIAHGMNEHIHRLSEYRRSARRAGLRLRVLFPESVRRQIAGTVPAPSRSFGLVARGLRWLPAPVLKRLLEPAHMLVGLPLVAVLEASGARSTMGGGA